ncbi:serine O-acetyltransferase [Schlesneria sp. DSM 10557]|uniref:serine O-acetyltransferase n=1 Tax=Schlesneria sp. DSM 10557 TaxID=3044399 RepID=UPI00359F2101
MPLNTVQPPVEMADGLSLRVPDRNSVDSSDEGPLPSYHSADAVWDSICREARDEERRGSCLCAFLNETVLQSAHLEQALSSILCAKLATESVGKDRIQSLLMVAYQSSAAIRLAIRNDLQAIVDRDPVAKGYLAPFVFFKGFQALQAYRVANWHWNHDGQFLAAFLQSRISEVFAVDIHPAARIGSGILMDHATGIVVGETSVIEDNVSILHEVTLGGTGKQSGDRHPKVRQGVLIGAGAKILGNVEIGAGAKIGAGSVVLDSVPPHCTAAGVPARIVARNSPKMPALDMDQQFPHHFEDGSGI